MFKYNIHEYRVQKSYSVGKIIPLNAQYAIRSLVCPTKINVTCETNLFHYIDMAQHCKEQDIEICALKLSFGTLNICVLTLYRAPSGNFGSFLLKPDTILQSLYTPKLHFNICWDININYLNESENKNQLDNLLLSYNLISIINFPMRVQNTSVTAIDNIFIDVSQLESYTVTPITNNRSDHDAQLLIISTDYSHAPVHKLKTIRTINRFTISDFIDR